MVDVVSNGRRLASNQKKRDRIREPYIDLAALNEGERFGRHFLTPFGGNHRV